MYLYYFRWETPIDGGRLKSPHTIEIPFAFDNVKVARLTASSPDAPALADKVSDAWIAFARNRRPEHAEAAALAGVQPEGPPTMVFDNAERGGERSDAGAAARDVQRDEPDVTLESGLRTLDSGLWTPDSGLWTR